MARRWTLWLWLLIAGGCLRAESCPSPAGGSCDPRLPNCPATYHCALAEVCTKACEATSDCWVPTSAGCVPGTLPGQRLPDGGLAQEEEVVDDICPESRHMACVAGYCQKEGCADGGCDYDVYGPSPFKGSYRGGPTK